jgi:hypothetical protein
MQHNTVAFVVTFENTEISVVLAMTTSLIRLQYIGLNYNFLWSPC